MTHAIIVGAGLGGLSAAIELAARGADVTVFEAAGSPGGKAGTVILDGVEVDTGPSVLTMPDVVDALLKRGGRSLGDAVILREPQPAFRYIYPDGAVVDVDISPEATLANVQDALGSDARAELERFLAYSKRIWDASAPHFVYGPAPSFAGVLSLGIQALTKLTRIDPLRSMKRAIDAQIRSPHLRKLLARYATYNGSDVRSAPATLNCIAHVELALGGFGVEGGMSQIVRALVAVAEELGATFHYNAPVSELVLSGRRVTGVVVDGRPHTADVVVANADPALVMDTLLPSGTRHGLHRPTGSMSGWNGILRARRRTGDDARVAHTVYFCEDYDQEFADIFDRDRPPKSPTVYVCAQERNHNRRGWADEEPVFVMANAPPEPLDGPRPQSVWSELSDTVMTRLLESGLRDEADRLAWQRTPSELAARFPGSRGSIYGGASNDMFAAFRRPPNRISGVPGLYMASGGAHPGGGMPLAMLSGQAAAEAIAADHNLAQRSA
ncbi:MAG: phytoene desaturase family protein [Myxococcota bacterium]